MQTSINDSYIITPSSGAYGMAQDGPKGACQPFSVSAMLPSIFLVIQCALLHPTFSHSKAARLVRMGLTPINFVWWLRLPFQHCFKPLETSAQFNMTLATMGMYNAIKSLEWGFASGSYYKRPLITTDGVSRWEKTNESDDSYKKVQEEEPCDAFKLMAWTTLLMTSSV